MNRKPIRYQCTDREWRDMCDKIRACCPPPEGYRWRFERSAKMAVEGNRRGFCSRLEPTDKSPGRIWIRVQRGMSESETADVLIHEVAHSYDMWTHHAWAGDHSDTMWIWVGRVYRRFHGES